MTDNLNSRIFRPDPKLKLMDQVRQVLRYHHYAYRTEQSYCDWIIRYIKFHGGNTHPGKMGKKEIDAFLSHLATHLHVSAATQRQALDAIVFLYPVRLVSHLRSMGVFMENRGRRCGAGRSCVGVARSYWPALPA